MRANPVKIFLLGTTPSEETFVPDRSWRQVGSGVDGANRYETLRLIRKLQNPNLDEGGKGAEDCNLALRRHAYVERVSVFIA